MYGQLSNVRRARVANLMVTRVSADFLNIQKMTIDLLLGTNILNGYELVLHNAKRFTPGARTFLSLPKLKYGRRRNATFSTNAQPYFQLSTQWYLFKCRDQSISLAMLPCSICFVCHNLVYCTYRKIEMITTFQLISNDNLIPTPTRIDSNHSRGLCNVVHLLDDRLWTKL